MVLLESGVNTNRCFTLYEKSTLGTYSYIIFFVADPEGRQYGCKLTDVSTFPQRFNKFTITVQANPTPLSGEVELYREGFYHYYAYEISNIATFDFDWVGELDFTDLQSYLEDNHSFTGEVVLVETGKMQYTRTATTYNHYADTRTPVKSYQS